MRKITKLALSRETLRHLDTLRLAAGGLTAATVCAVTCNNRSICVDTCEQFCKGTTVC